METVCEGCLPAVLPQGDECGAAAVPLSQLAETLLAEILFAVDEDELNRHAKAVLELRRRSEITEAEAGELARRGAQTREALGQRVWPSSREVPLVPEFQALRAAFEIGAEPGDGAGGEDPEAGEV
jgi:hypothetical protein